MKEMFDQVYAHFLADTALVAAVPGGLWFLTAQQSESNANPSTDRPYMVYMPVTIDPTFRTFTEERVQYLFQFMAFADKVSELATIDSAMRGNSAADAGFDFASIQVSGYEADKMVRESENWTYDNETRVYQLTITYSIFLEQLEANRT